MVENFSFFKRDRFKNKFSIYTDINNYLHVSEGYTAPNKDPLDLNYNFIHFESDLMDIKRGAIFTYTLNKNNTEIYDDEKRQKLLLKTLYFHQVLDRHLYNSFCYIL